MERLLYISALTLILACFAATLISALPYEYSMDVISAYDSDDCRLCYALEDGDACAQCIASISDTATDFGKRSDAGLYHPFFRGGYPKKSIYIPRQNPLLRGGYYKKTYVPRKPLYHPMLRGGYGGYRAPTQYNPNLNNY